MYINKVLHWLSQQEDNMIALLGDPFSIDSFSRDKAGVDAVGARIRAFLEDEGIECSVTEIADQGDVLHGRLESQGGNAPVLLMGHMDTVFPSGEAARRPFTVEGNVGRAPGCADMKAGLVMNTFLLAGFKRMGGDPLPLHGLFTGDEEIGSPDSRPIIEKAASEAIAVFNAEPGRVSGNIVSSRRGGRFYRVGITGRAAHAGLNPHDGRSAIHELGRKIVAWNALNDADEGISVNVGLVAGGQTVNIVAPSASAEVDLRFTELGDDAVPDAAIRKIAEECEQDGVTAEISELGTFLPMAKNDQCRDLTALYLGAARELGQATEAEFTRSCADSGVASATGTATVCATGPVGGKAHSRGEYVELDTFVPRDQAVVPRDQAVALSIAKLADRGTH